jgi:hypothetical protein
MPDDAANLPARYPNGRFGPGHMGRPVGSYNRNSRNAALAALDHFERNQERVLDRLANGQIPRGTDIYLRFIGRLLPRQIAVGPSDGQVLSEEQMAAALTHAHTLFDGSGDRGAALAELESLLLGVPKKQAGDH